MKKYTCTVFRLLCLESGGETVGDETSKKKTVLARKKEKIRRSDKNKRNRIVPALGSIS